MVSRGLTWLLAPMLALACSGVAVAGPSEPLSNEGRWLTDARGRTVILHGWNMVYKIGSYLPEDAGFGSDDARFLARHGFNTVRLGLTHKGLEPRLPGPDGHPRYRRSYLRGIERTERVLARRGIYSLLDFHQDLYNERFQGEGLPDWAVVGDARTLPPEPRQGFPANYLGMQALNRAFDHFWTNDRAADGRRLQEAYGAAWRHVAKRFRSNPHVLGYNLFNEPWPGSQYPSCVSPTGCPAFDRQFLEPFSKRIIEAIRTVDRRTLVWYAPLLTFDFGADTSHGDTGDRNAGFAFNMYCLADGLGFPGGIPGPPGQAACDAGYELTLDNAESQSSETGDALLMTEFAATDDLDTVERVVELADKRMISWQQWHYCACDDPTTAARPLDAQALVKDPSKPPRGRNLDRDKLRISARPYPQTVAGMPRSFDFDDDTRIFDLRYSTRRASGQGRFGPGSVSEVFVPALHYRKGYAVELEGARVVSSPGARTLRLKSCRGAKRVGLRVTPQGRTTTRCSGSSQPGGAHGFSRSGRSSF